MSCLKSMGETVNRKSECYIPGDDVTPDGTEWSMSIYYSINVSLKRIRCSTMSQCERFMSVSFFVRCAHIHSS
jgi:hypothetical protein